MPHGCLTEVLRISCRCSGKCCCITNAVLRGTTLARGGGLATPPPLLRSCEPVHRAYYHYAVAASSRCTRGADSAQVWLEGLFHSVYRWGLLDLIASIPAAAPPTLLSSYTLIHSADKNCRKHAPR